MIDRELKEALTPFLTGDHEAFATTLLSGLMKVYGVDILNWEGETIQLEVKDDFGVEMPRKVYDKLMGLIAALTTDEVYKDVPLFDEIVSALAGRGIGVEKDIPSVDDLAWAVTEMRMVDPDPTTRDPEEPWGRDIKKYARVVLDDEGMNIAPKALDFADSRAVKKEGHEDETYYAGAWGGAQARADEVDTWIESKVVELLQQLMSLGISFDGYKSDAPTKKAPAKKNPLLSELEARIA